MHSSMSGLFSSGFPSAPILEKVLICKNALLTSSFESLLFCLNLTILIGLKSDHCFVCHSVTHLFNFAQIVGFVRVVTCQS